MTTELFTRILNDHKELTALPQTMAAVLRIAADEESSAREMSDTLSRDPALTAKLLRVVNSPFYGVGREVSSVKQAVMTVGNRAVTALVLSSSVYDLTGKWKTTIDRKRFWRHSLEVAIASRLISETVKYPFPDEAFVAGLLHDVGLLVLEKSFPEQFAKIWQNRPVAQPFYELEHTTWGTDHAKAGQFLFEQWNLPTAICTAVGKHHSIAQLSNEQTSLLPKIVALANIISRFKVTSTSQAPETVNDRHALCEQLGLTDKYLHEIEGQLLNKVVEEARFLEMEIGSIDEILTEANKMLYEQYLTVEALLRENRRMQEEIAKAKVKKAALEALQTITATFNHYINNASATILGRAQLVEISIQQGNIGDPRGTAAMSMQVISNSVNTICAVMNELKSLTEFETISYHDTAYILDIEQRIQKHLEHLEAIAHAEN